MAYGYFKTKPRVALAYFFKRFGLLSKGRVKHGVRHCFNEFLFLQHIYGRNYYTILKLTP